MSVVRAFKSFAAADAQQIDIVFLGTSVTVTPGQTLDTTIGIDPGYNFYWFASSFQPSQGGVAYLPSDEPFIPLVNVSMIDSGLQRAIIAAPGVPVTAIASMWKPVNRYMRGSGFISMMPYRLPLPRLFAANSQLQFTWTNIDSVNAYEIDFVMHGFRLPPSPSAS